MKPITIVPNPATIKTAARIASGTSLPILNNLLLHNGTLTADDSSVQFTARLCDKEHEPIALPAETFAKIVELHPREPLVIEDKGGQVEVVTGSGKYTLATLPADDFPRRAQEPAKTQFDCPEIVEDLRSIAWALPRKDHRRVLMGVHLEVLGGLAVRITAADGKQLAQRKVGVKDLSGADSAACTIPGPVVRMLESETRIGIGERSVSFTSDAGSVVAQSIEGKYPDVSAVIPKDWRGKIKGDSKAIAKAVRAALVTSDQRGLVVLVFGERPTVSSAAADIGTASVDLPVECEGDVPAEVGVNAGMLVELLAAFPGDVEIDVRDAVSPLRVEREETLAVLMPVKLADIRKGEQ